MARRYKEPKPQPPKLNDPNVFLDRSRWTERLNIAAALMRGAVRFPIDEARAALPDCPPDESDSTTVGRFFDRTFGIKAGFSRAAVLWAAHDTINKMPKPVRDELADSLHDYLIEVEPNRHYHTFRISSDGGNMPVLFSGRVNTMYPLGDTTCSYSKYRGCETFTVHTLPVNDVRQANPTTEVERYAVRAIHAWVYESVRVHRDALSVSAFLESAAQCAGSTKALFDTLPGLRAAMERFPYVVSALSNVERDWPLAFSKAFEADRRADTFNIRMMGERVPNWSSEWARIRGLLLAMAMVNNNPPVPGPIREAITAIHAL